MCSITSREHSINNLYQSALIPINMKSLTRTGIMIAYDYYICQYYHHWSYLFIVFMSPGSKCFPPGTIVASLHCSQNGPGIATSVVLSHCKHRCSKGCQPTVSCWDAPGSWIYSGWRVGSSSPDWRDWSARQQRKWKLRFPKSSLEGPQWEALSTLPRRGKTQNVQYALCRSWYSLITRWDCISSWVWSVGEDQLRPNLEENTCGPAVMVSPTQEGLPYLLWATGTENPVWEAGGQHGTQVGEKDLRLGDFQRQWVLGRNCP